MKKQKNGTLVLVRHGESRWNVYNRFTGWVDVPLSSHGVVEAEICAKHCKKFDFDAAFTSKLERAQATLTIILSKQNRTGIVQHMDRGKKYAWLCNSSACLSDEIPIYDSEALNERYYGILQGMEKKEAEKKYGEEKVLGWRRGYAAKPPKGESLREAHARMLPCFKKQILPRVQNGESVIVCAHGNSLRGMIKHIEEISDDDIAFIDLPEATPIVYTYEKGDFLHTSGEYDFNRPLR